MAIFACLDLDLMNEEGRAYQNDESLQGLVKRFEAMMARGDSQFFDVEELEELISYYLDNREVRRAESVLHYAAEVYPGHLAFNLKQAQILANSGKHVKAVPILRDLLEIEPTNDEVHMTLGSIYSQMQEHKLAIRHFRKALEFGDEDLRRDMYIEVALEYENLGDWHQAIHYLKSALAEDPTNETAVYELAFCFEQTGAFSNAAEYYRQFLENQPYSFAAWYSLGNALQSNGRYTEAIDAYDFAIAIEDSFGPAYLQKADALSNMERFADALEVYRESLEHEPASANTICYMGECFERMGDLNAAEKFYRESLDLDPQFSDAYVGLGVLADLREEYGVARLHFEQALRLDPGNQDYLLMLGTTFKKLGEHEEAEALFAESLGNHPRFHDMWLERVDNLQLQDEHVRALECIEEALGHVKRDVHLRIRQFVSLYALRRDAAAFRLLESLLINHYDETEILITLNPALANDARFLERYDRFKP